VKLTMKTFAVIALLASAGAIAGTLEHPFGQNSVFSERALEERIAPVGAVCVEGEECGSAAAAEQVASGPRSGSDVYNSACAGCHASGAAGAPVTGNAGDWAPRIGKGMSTLVTHAVDGFNAMPAMGLCMDCSRDEIKAAVEYMVAESK
jgi:cytochrome c5